MDDCSTFKIGDNYIGNFSSDISITIITSKNTYICAFEKQLLSILSDTKRNVNLTLTVIDEWSVELSPHFHEHKDTDMALIEMTINEWLMGFAESQWIKEQYNFVILSPLFERPNDMTNMLNMFSLHIWLAMLLLTVAFTMLIYMDRIAGDFERNNTSMVNIVFELLRHLFNQAQNQTVSNRFLITIWSFNALIMIASFSGGVHRSVVNRQQTPINSFDELIDSRLTVLNNNNSWIWWQFRGFEEWKNPVPHKLSLLKDRMRFIDKLDDSKEFAGLLVKDSVFVSEYWNVLWKHNWLQSKDWKLDVAEEKYFYSLIGYPVNKVNKRDDTIRRHLIETIKRMVEIGINVKVESIALYRLNMATNGFGSKNEGIEEEDEVSGGENGIEIELIKSLFIWVSVCLAISVSTLFAEIVYKLSTKRDFNPRFGDQLNQN